MVMGSVVAVVVVRRSLFVRRSLLLSLPLSLPVVSPLPLSLPFDFRIALHSTACPTLSHIISSHPSYLTLSFGHLLAGCCLLLLTRSPTTCCLQLPTCSLSPGRSKTSLSVHGEAKGPWRVPRCSAQRVITPKVTSVRGPERRDSTTLRVATAHYPRDTRRSSLPQL